MNDHSERGAVSFVDAFTGAIFWGQSIARGRYRHPKYGTAESKEAANALAKFRAATLAAAELPDMTPEGFRGLLGDVRSVQNQARAWKPTTGAAKGGAAWDPATSRECRTLPTTPAPEGAPMGAKSRARRAKWRAARRDPITGAPLTFPPHTGRGRPRLYNGPPGTKNPRRLYEQRYGQILTALARVRQVCPITPKRKADLRTYLAELYQDLRTSRNDLIY